MRLKASSTSHPLGATWGDEEDRADVLAFDPGRQEQARLRDRAQQLLGLTIQPATGELWCVVNERDELGDDLPPDYATHVAGRRVLRLALVLHRRKRGSAA